MLSQWKLAKGLGRHQYYTIALIGDNWAPNMATFDANKYLGH